MVSSLACTQHVFIGSSQRKRHSVHLEQRQRTRLSRRTCVPALKARNSPESDIDGDSTVEKPLWRQNAKRIELPVLDVDDFDSDEIQREAQRLAKKQAIDKISNASYKELFQQEEQEQDGKLTIKEAVDKILVADFFLITLSLIWFLTGVLQQSISGDDSLLTGWLKLWTPLFQPALGVFMAGAAISGLSSWLSKRT